MNFTQGKITNKLFKTLYKSAYSLQIQQAKLRSKMVMSTTQFRNILSDLIWPM